MKRKFIGILLIVALVATLAFGLVACNNGGDDRYTIVYLGDSIAEALIGPSPLSERDNYGYYAIVGKTNGFRYYNHSVSGHKTSTGIVSGDGLLEMISRDDENAVLMKSHIKQADMIHVSVLGNNVLQYNIGLMLLEVADPEFEAKYEAGKTAENAEDKTLINALEDGSIDEPLYRDSVDDPNGEPVEFDFPPTYDDICKIVDRLKALNPDATIVFQKVYNPFFEGSKHLTDGAKAKLAEIIDDGRFGAEGDPIATMAQYRKLADYLLGKLNGILDRYLDSHEGAFKVLDASEAFQEVVELRKNPDNSVNLSEDSLGRKLIYADWTHPSNLGHAVIAGMTQDLLDEMKVSSPNALANYKALRVDQINRLFKNIDGFDADAAIAAINSAEKYLDVTLAYFDAIDGYTPVVQEGSYVTNNKKTSFSKTVRFNINTKNTNLNIGDIHISSGLLALALPVVTDSNNTYLEFTSDGKMHGQIQTAAGLFGETLDSLFNLLNQFQIDFDRDKLNAMISGVEIEGMIDSYMEPMFPGFKAELSDADLAGALNLIHDGLGFNITGLDYNDEGVKEILAYVADNMALPADLLDKIPADTQLTLTFDSQYYVKDVKGTDGKKHKAIYVSAIGANDATQPYCVFDVTENSKGDMCLFFRFEFMGVNLAFTEKNL
ncbi:MAG: hypothetical protein NC037_00230 [Bacteroides sp.]|nr:hypothetical protein [Bacillota bacterium]MCM1393754.1 hypothetical protein [[Eubacterium] siraeum]MCM1454945.1 hypothetical protein [Bacteroides sp.]